MSACLEYNEEPEGTRVASKGPSTELALVRAWHKRASYLETALMRVALAFNAQDEALTKVIEQLQKTLAAKRGANLNLKQIDTIVNALISFGHAAGLKSTIDEYRRAAQRGDTKAAQKLARMKYEASGAHGLPATHSLIECPHCGRGLRMRNPTGARIARCKCEQWIEYSPDAYGNIHVYAIGKPCLPAQRRSRQAKEKDYVTLRDCYEILGVSPGASSVDIRRAYQQKIKQYHPDKVCGLGEKIRTLAEHESRRINEAYKKLQETMRV